MVEALMRRTLCALAVAFALGGCDDPSPDGDHPPHDTGAVIGDAAVEADAVLLDVGVLDAAPLVDDGVESDLAPATDLGPTLDFGPPDPIDEVIIVDAPADAPDRFAALPIGDCLDRPAFIYPEPDTALPRNIEGIDVQWAAGRRGGDPLFEVELIAVDARVRYYTVSDHLVPTGAAWERVKTAAALAPDRALHIIVREFRGAGAPACVSDPLPLEVSPSQLRGAVYYWSTGQASIMRLPVNDAEAEPFLTPFNSGNGCPACHAVSRDGTRIAYTRTTFPPFGYLGVATIDAPTVLLYPADAQMTAGYFPSFAPDSLRIVAGSGGRLVIRDADTGAELGEVPRPADTVAGSPDWSWQGDRIAAALGPAGLFNPLPDVGISSGDIAQWQLVGGVWQMPTRLVERSDDWWYDRPAYSPLGQWVAYNRIGDDPFGGMEGSQAINPNTDIWLVSPDGGPPVYLERANGGELLGNSWPKWAPMQGNGRVWLAFTSLRSYGRVLNNQPGIDATPQIWVTGIDPDAPPGSDPSAPAFWMPGQSTQSGNHAPYWAPYEKE